MTSVTTNVLNVTMGYAMSSEMTSSGRLEDEADILDRIRHQEMLESVKQSNRISMHHLPHLTFNHTATHSRGAMDGSLLASLQVTNHKHGVSNSILYDTWFKMILIGCVVVMFLTMFVRFIMWKRNCRRVSYQTGPNVSQRTLEHFSSSQFDDYSEDEDFSNAFMGVSMPLLQDASGV